MRNEVYLLLKTVAVFVLLELDVGAGGEGGYNSGRCTSPERTLQEEVRICGGGGGE